MQASQVVTDTTPIERQGIQLCMRPIPIMHQNPIFKMYDQQATYPGKMPAFSKPTLDLETSLSHKPTADHKAGIETPQAILKPKHSLTLVSLATSKEAFGIPYFQRLTGDWETSIKMRPILQTIKKLGEEALAECKNLNPDIDRFDDQGEDVIVETYNLFRERLQAANMQDKFRNIITAMMDATENQNKNDKKHRVWLFRCLLSQAKRNSARRAKRRARKAVSQCSEKRARVKAPEAQEVESLARSTVAGQAHEVARRKREHVAISELIE
ncbi:hypothetical protein TWF696_007556 [Orbilia brochopaga]|uniref:Uncharacterized protein n=1 Tax=Orbilia brochopaga TaxID=3140254 RepID=A0AAV9UKQ1_9PEZI